MQLRSKNTLEFKLTYVSFPANDQRRGFKTEATEILRLAKHVIVSVRLTHKYLEKWTKDIPKLLEKSSCRISQISLEIFQIFNN